MKNKRLDMDKGYIRLWRKSIDSGLIKNHNVWIFWTWCLMKANHKKDFKQIVGFKEIILQPGDFVFGRKLAANETGLSEQNIRTCLTFLKKCKNLTIKSTNKFSIISITNWGTYQHAECETNQRTNQQVTSSQPAGNHKQEQKNKRTKEEIKKKIKKKSFSGYLEEQIIQNNFIESKDKIFEFYEYRMEMPAAKKYKSEKGINGLFRDLNGCREAGLIVSECLEIAMEKGWMTPGPGYFKNNNQTRQGNLSRSEQNALECQKFIEGAGDEK